MAIPIAQEHVGPGEAAAVSPGDAIVGAIPAGSGASALALPAASFVTDGQFVRQGADLVITDAGGGQVIVTGYFAAEPPPDLTSPDGSQLLTPALVDAFLMPAMPGQYAQAAPFAGSSPIGQVLDLEGEAFAIRADGTRVQLAKGDAVFEGDIVETGTSGSAIRMVFTDKTEFSLGPDARLSLDRLVFNPDTQAGEAQFAMLKGIFIFASGQIAKTDNTDMTVMTSVATIGIRGTEVAGRVSASDSQFTVIDGAIEVTTQAGSVTLDARGETTSVAGNDVPPGEPVVLTAAEFGQAYGDMAGVAAGYFGRGVPGMQNSPPGFDAPSGPAGPGEAAPDHGDRSDAGAGEGLAGVASIVAPETQVLLPLAATLVDIAAAPPGLAAPEAPVDIPPAGLGLPAEDFASGLTFSVGMAPAAAPAGFELFPLMENNGRTSVDGAADIGLVQVAFAPVAAVADLGAAPAVHADAPEPPSLDQISTGGGESPLRIPSGPATGNPYITDPYGYSGPELGDPVFDLVAPAPTASAGPAAGADQIRTAAELVPEAPAELQPGPGDDAPSPEPAPEPEPAEIVLTLSNATLSQQYQDLTFSLELPNLGPGSSVLVSGSDLQAAMPGVPASAAVSVDRDGHGNVEVALTSAWNSVKNIRAESATAADITIDNFVHADVAFGGGGDSDITIRGAKRGIITTGDGNDRIEIDAFSNGDGWSHLFDVQSGDGDDTLLFDGAPGGRSRLSFDGGAGTDTLKLSGAGESFSLLPGEIRITGVERIDISGTGTTTVALPSHLTDPPDLLIVDGDSEDVLVLQGNGWVSGESIEIEGQSYAVYEHESGTRVAADADLQVV